MQKANKISAFFFLGLFSLMMLHQAFPHLHHQHEDSHSHSNVTHSGEHHHDDGSKENEESPFGFFDLFMDMHVHSTSSNEVVVFERNLIERQTKIAKDSLDHQFTVQNLFSLDEREIDKPLIYHPPNKYFNPYLSYLDLRGPPALG